MRVVHPNTYLAEGKRARKQLGLERLWEFVKTQNQARHLPYHNNLHPAIVQGVSAVLADDEGADLGICVLAAMMHDFNHKGHGPDWENIKLSSLALSWANSQGFVPKSIDVLEALAAIRVTQYEYPNFISMPMTAEQRVIRDADVWTPHLPVNLGVMNILGLGEELGKWDAKTYAYPRNIRSQKNFFEQLSWYTKRGQYLSKFCSKRIQGWTTPEKEHIWSLLETEPLQGVPFMRSA